MNSEPNSASTADDATNFKMVQRVKIVLLGVIGYPCLGTETSKKWPDS